MEELIKLKVKHSSIDKNDQDIIIEKFIEACENLDASVFEPLIEEDQYFQELDKYRFLASLKKNFDKAHLDGAKKSTLIMGSCQHCERGHVTHQFNHGADALFSYIIYKKDGNLIDIFQCNWNSGRNWTRLKRVFNEALDKTSEEIDEEFFRSDREP